MSKVLYWLKDNKRSLIIATGIMMLIYLYVTQYSWFKQNEFLATWLIGIAGLIFAGYAFQSKYGHKISILYSRVCDGVSEPYFEKIYITNHKDKAEIITEINVLYGGNVWLQLKKYEYEKELLIIPPYETRVVELEPVSLYAVNTQIVDMSEMILHSKAKTQFVLATPTGLIKPQITKPLLFNSYVKDALSKMGFAWVVPYHHKVNGRVLGYKIKYTGIITLSTGTKYNFYVHSDGALLIDGMPLCMLTKTQMISIASVKKHIQQIKIHNKSVRTVEITTNHKHIGSFSFGKHQEAKSPIVIPRCKYYILQKIAQIKHKKKKQNK